MWDVLRVRGFRLLWGAGLASEIGSWMMIVAVPALVYDLTGSTTATAVAVLAETVPVLVLGPFAGVLADRWDHRTTMVVVDLVRAAAVLAILCVRDASTVWVVFVAMTAESTAGLLFAPAQAALVPRLVGRGPRLDSANAVSSVTGGVIRLVGGPLGGAAYALWGIEAVVLADAASYVVSAMLLVFLPRSRAVRGRATVRLLIDELVDGLRAVVRSRLLRGLAITSVVFFAANGAATTVLAPLVAERLDGGAGTLGLLMAALGIGYLLGGMLSAKVSAVGSLTIATCGFLLLALASHPIIGAVACAVIGVGGSILLVVLRTATQRRAPEGFVGRASASLATVQTAATVAGAALATTASLTGLLIAVVLGVALSTVVAAVAVPR
ncbi:MFS transporter [Tenggerimyces flavus]|uniref:MFS transporter n=1 Tax=Tenggerimyces flavus TaxID=1708749 RepID=A0ABV7YE68_9ACTN|nr:MFS transporter [Tenggerimyces flavus]MBM7784330.1 MFS family permease [Tenggerimyces flavus]